MYMIASISGFLAVAIGAFGAHGLKQFVTTKQIEVFQTGVSYQFYHVFAMFIAAYFFKKIENVEFKWSFRFFFLGVILFSGSLYAYVISGLKFFALITPSGGLSFLVGWILLAIGFYRSKENAA